MQEELRPSVTPEQLEQLRRVRQDWLRTMGPLLAARNHQLSRPTLQSWEAAFAALGGLQKQAGEMQRGASTAAGPAHVQTQALQPGGDLEAAAHVYGSMAEAGRSRESLQRELRHLADSYHRGWLCLVRFLLAILQVSAGRRVCSNNAANRCAPPSPAAPCPCTALCTLQCKCNI
jgi:hypothetical protein